MFTIPTQHAPKIRISANTNVTVDPISTFADLLTVSGKLASIEKATPGSTVPKLVTAVGDLSASVVQNGDTLEVAEETAGVVVAALGIAAMKGVSADLLLEAIRDTVSRDVNRVFVNALGNVLPNAKLS